MKENTIFHFGTAQVKFACFRKRGSNGRANRTSGGQRQSNRYYLRRTDAAGSSDIKRIPAQLIAEWQARCSDLAEAMVWAEDWWQKLPPARHTVRARKGLKADAHCSELAPIAKE